MANSKSSKVLLLYSMHGTCLKMKKKPTDLAKARTIKPH